MRWVGAFLAGFLSTLIFHQGLLALLHAAGASPRPAYVMTAAPPLGVPQVLSLAFWGVLWGIVGMILAVPMLVILKIVLDNIKETRPLATLMSNM